MLSEPLPPIIDADGHVVEPEATWADHLDSRFLDFVPRAAAGARSRWTGGRVNAATVPSPDRGSPL